MNFLVLVVSFAFAATVHANSNLPKVLAVKYKDTFHPLSRPFEASSPSSQETPLVWGHPLGVPVEFSHAEFDSLLSTNVHNPGYLRIQPNQPFVLQKIPDTHTASSFLGQKLNGKLFASCPYSKNILGSSSTVVYNTVVPVGIHPDPKCELVDVFLLPFDSKTRKVAFPEDERNAETVTSLTVPPDLPLALFIQVQNTWFPLTVDYVGPNQDSYSLLYDVELQYPLDFKIDSQKEQLVSANQEIPGFACFEQSSVAIFKNPCPKSITVGEKNKVSKKKIFVCEGDKKLYYQESKGCQAVDIHLFYYERGNKGPLVNVPVVGLGLAPVSVSESGSDSRAAPVFKTTRDDSSKKVSWVFYLKDEGSFIPLSTRLFKDGVSHFYYDKSKTYPEFEYVNGIATTEYAPTPGSVMFDEGNLLVGRTDNPTAFNIDINGIVDHEFYLCGLKSDYERALFTSNPGDTYSNCAREDVYFLPHDKVKESVPESSVDSTGETTQEVTPDKGSQDTPKTPVSGTDTSGLRNDIEKDSGTERKETQDAKSEGSPKEWDNVSQDAKPNIEVAGNNIQDSGVDIEQSKKDSSINVSGSETENSGSKVESAESKQDSPKDTKGSDTSASKSEQLDKSKVGSLPDSSKAKANMEDINECTTKCNETTEWVTLTDYTTYCQETKIVGDTLKEHPEAEGGLSRGENSEQRVNKVAPGQLEKEGSELNKGQDRFGNSGKSDNSGNISIPKPTVEPFVNAASKNALGACVLGFAAFLLL